MNNENVIDFMENKSNFNSAFDFSQNIENDFINIDDDEDDIIIGKPKQESLFENTTENLFDSEPKQEDLFETEKKQESLFDTEKKQESLFENEDKILSILNDEPKEQETIQAKPVELDTKETLELDSFFDSIYNGVEDANTLISQINLKKQTLTETEQEIANLKEQMAREKEEFTKYME